MRISDLLDHKFETFELPGELGKFMGKLERNKTSILLEGPAGSGKSTFALQLANLLMNYGLRGKYFSLEMGLTEGLKDTARRINLNPGLVVSADGDLDDIRREAARNDFLVIDSWQMLRVKPKDFEQLRQDYPYCIFIIIFQLTQDGKIRGGSEPTFNCTAHIKVSRSDENRSAFMQKSRYGTIGWKYSITEDKVILEY